MNSHQAPHINSFSESLFFNQLKTLSADSESTSLKNLVSATQHLLESAEAISKQVVRFLPQFTLHDGVHLWNVLSFMEELAGGTDGIERLQAGDCAMAIWAAFIHDLGMVLEAGELAALDAADDFDSNVDADHDIPDDKAEAWRAYRDGHHHWSVIRKNPDDAVNRMRLGIIRAAFVRDSHARDDAHSGQCRISEWLNFLSESDPLIGKAIEDYAIYNQVVRVAVSHNQDINWLSRQLGKLGMLKPHEETCGADLGTIHWTWIGWILRLADVFDCDKSRTPPVLFDYTGITDDRSRAEWQKHLAIREAPQWSCGPDNQTLLFTCHKCPSPIVEKAIHQIIEWMNNEIEKVHVARQSSPNCNSLPVMELPSQAQVDIKQRESGYLYHDMEFRLDRDAVVELLMGESLYGGPELSLRELVQNALDAVHLRDQRTRLAEKLTIAGGTERLRQPNQPWAGQPAKVSVTWGQENGRSFICVEDSGVGMTVGTMRRFLTEIGKSYYKSDDFRSEQELMRRHGILCTAISQFGIGFLSVFMLADKVTIFTRPVGVIDDNPPSDTNAQETARFPFRAEIDGPHGLLAFYPDKSKKLPGTSVTLWLKENTVLHQWNRDVLIARLRNEFYDLSIPKAEMSIIDKEHKKLKKGQQLLDPGLEISRFIIWPLYPVELSPDSATSLVLSESLHHHELIPFNRDALQTKAKEWEFTIPEIEETGWSVCDWIDETETSNGIEGTGSRIRLIGPQLESKDAPLTLMDWTKLSEYLPSGQPRLLLASFSEAHLPSPISRYQCLVNGVRVVPGLVPNTGLDDSKLPSVVKELPILPGVGGWVWIDLRGTAMPRLRADRSAPISTQPNRSAWRELMERWDTAQADYAPAWLQHQFLCSHFQSQKVDKTDCMRVGLTQLGPNLFEKLLQAEVRLKQVFKRITEKSDYLARLNYHIGYDIDFRNTNLNVVCDLDADLQRARSFDDACASVDEDYHEQDHGNYVITDLAEHLTLEPEEDYERESAKDRKQELEFAGAALLKHPNWRSKLMISGIHGHLASYAIKSNLTGSLAASALSGVEGRRNDLSLVGPLHVAMPSHSISEPAWIGEYDFIYPYSVFPLKTFRSKCPNWSSYGVLYTLPFLFGLEPNENWREVLGDTRPFDSLFLFLPNPDHWEQLFNDLSKEEWGKGSASALWNLKTGKVIYADGIHSRESIQIDGIGKTFTTWLEQSG